MQVVCRMCHHVYNHGRARCPACGTTVKKSMAYKEPPLEPAFPLRRRKEAAPKPAKEKKRRRDGCALCQRRSKNMEPCVHCKRPVHPRCLRLHHAMGCRVA